VIYFDTSYLVRLYYQDPGANAVRALAATDHVASASHGQAEMIAAFHRKFREGSIRPVAFAALIDQVRTHIEDGAFYWLAQNKEILSMILKVYENLPPTVFLRAADAIHLATAAESGFRVVFSNDAHLLAAAKHFGLEGKNVI
jgi:predicted nucleic acid-binding protein